MENGLTWLGNNFSVQTNPGPGGLGIWNMYYLYAVERVGRMTSHRFFTSRDFRRYDWYRMGAEWLIAEQDALSGFWKGEGHAEDDPHIATSFALLFLAKGRRPVLISKARYGSDDDWNEHRADLAQSDRLCRNEMEARFSPGPVLANCRSGRRLGRRSAAIAGAVHQRQPKSRAAGPGAQTARIHRPRRIYFRRGLLPDSAASTPAFAN